MKRLAWMRAFFMSLIFKPQRKKVNRVFAENLCENFTFSCSLRLSYYFILNFLIASFEKLLNISFPLMAALSFNNTSQ